MTWAHSLRSIERIQRFHRHGDDVISTIYMEDSGKYHNMSDFQGVVPIRTCVDDYSYKYSQRYTWSGDQGALSRFSTQKPPDFIKTELNDIPKLQLDHLQSPPTELQLSAAKQCPNIKQELHEYSTSKEVTNEYSRTKYPMSEFPAVRVQPEEFPTVNIRDLGSNVLQLSNADRLSSENSEVFRSQYLKNNLLMSLPLREPLVDMTNGLGSLDGGFSNGSTLNGQTNSSKMPLSQYLPVLRKSDFNSQGIQSTDEKSQTIKCLEGQERSKVKKSRKLQRPVKSAQRMDPNFRGATVILHTEIKDKNCSLTLSAHFSNINVYKHQTYRKRKRSGSYSIADSARSVPPVEHIGLHCGEMLMMVHHSVMHVGSGLKSTA
ncbi:uncharacterized protein LOC125669964 isoform X2 [Ostrea edulis]|uniref:uncharacterized protein LOC125669964 isoform X2 n=1 Tax=Ostrea edulis TaxID=37623 RepID=UPI0024AF67EC|nr:uncharacterized protein LOC125669964 isoform X2 [Ostrea edulis]